MHSPQQQLPKNKTQKKDDTVSVQLINTNQIIRQFSWWKGAMGGGGGGVKKNVDESHSLKACPKALKVLQCVSP